MADVFQKFAKPTRAQPSMGTRPSKLKAKLKSKRHDEDQSNESASFRMMVNRQIAANWKPPPERNESDVDPFAPPTPSRSAQDPISTPSFLASDEQEGGRMNIQHHLLHRLFNGSNTMGVPEDRLLSGMKVLDVGYGSGIWLAEMDRDYPAGEYFGVDINANPWAETFQSYSRDEGRGITLVRGNLNERLPFEDNTFDYVHEQMIASAIFKNRWPNLISELHRVLKPGGYIDFTEIDPMYEYHGSPTPALTEGATLFQRLAEPRGADVRIALELENLVNKNGGYINVACVKRATAIGWGGVAGLLWQENSRRGMVSLTSFACACLKITPEAWNDYITELNTDLPKARAVQFVYRVVARKSPV